MRSQNKESFCKLIVRPGKCHFRQSEKQTISSDATRQPMVALRLDSVAMVPVGGMASTINFLQKVVPLPHNL